MNIKHVTINSTFSVVSVETEEGVVIDAMDMTLEEYMQADEFVKQAHDEFIVS